MRNYRIKKNLLLKIIATLISFQIIRITIKHLLFLIVDKNSYSSDLITILIMFLLTITILIMSKKKNLKLFLLPELKDLKEKSIYIMATIIVIFLIITTPIFNKDYSLNLIVPLTLSAIATPIFEEFLFRGYVWNKLKSCYKSEFTVYIINTLLFAIWHLGYVDTIWFKVALRDNAPNIAYIMLMKTLTGLCFGIVLGFIRYRFKNCYASILAHSFMNIFGR